jgi:rare lipoprotein A
MAAMTGSVGRMAQRAVLVAAAAVLAGCTDGKFTLFGGGPDGGSADDPALMAGQTTELVQRDVEAPDVFQVTEAGLWDGRPSLGGVWVAHPDVTDPERVIIRNTENGTFVIGALFRRERDNPGPALQVSSDAAEALQMLAGDPAELNVTALRREEAPEPPAVTAGGMPDPDAPVADLAAAGEISATPLDPIAGAAAAIDAAEAQADAGAGAAAPATPAADIPAAVVAAAPPAEPVTSTLDQPFIQIGIFSVQANADGAAADMDAKGLPARVVPGQVQGQTYWRVLVGPAQTEAERADYLTRVKAEGFGDAYFVRN